MGAVFRTNSHASSGRNRYVFSPRTGRVGTVSRAKDHICDSRRPSVSGCSRVDCAQSSCGRAAWRGHFWRLASSRSDRDGNSGRQEDHGGHRPAGRIFFSDLADGVWTIQVEMLGFSAVKDEITVGPETKPSTWELKMLPLDQIHAEAQPIGPPPTPPPTQPSPTAIGAEGSRSTEARTEPVRE